MKNQEYIESIQLREKIFCLIKETNEQYKYLKVISKTKLPLSREDRIDFKDFVRKESKLNLLLHIYNALIYDDQKMIELQEISDEHCNYYKGLKSKLIGEMK